MTQAQQKLALKGKKIRYVSFWLDEADYFRLLELTVDEETKSSIARRALRRYLASLKRKGRK